MDRKDSPLSDHLLNSVGHLEARIAALEERLTKVEQDRVPTRAVARFGLSEDTYGRG